MRKGKRRACLFSVFLREEGCVYTGTERNYENNFKFFRKSMKNELTNSWHCGIMFFVNAVVAELADAQD